MKTNFLLFILFLFLLSACNVGVKKDLVTGVKVTNNGLSFKESYLLMDSVKLNSNEFPLGKTVYLYFTEVEGFSLKDGKVYPGASITVSDEKGNKLLENADAFAAYDQTGVTPEQVSVLFLNLLVGPPLQQGSKYFWKSKLWDKKGKGIIDAEFEFVVK